MRASTAALCALLLAATAAAEPEPGVLAGRIFDGETLRPVSTRFVKIATADGLELGAVGTDEKGRFRLPDVPPGFHRLYAWRGSEGSDLLPEIAVRPGETVEGVELVLRPRAVVRVRIETPSGREPVIEKCVLESPPDVVEAVRRVTGSLELRARPGTWTLYIHVRGFRTHVETLELEEYDRRFATIELSTGVSVLGRVLDGDGRPVADALVERLRVDSPLSEGASWTTDASGRYDLAGGVPATTRFRVSALGFETLRTRLDLTDAGFIHRHDFVLRRMAGESVLDGRVVDTSGKGVGGVPVSAGRPRSPIREVVATGPDGSFRFEGLPDLHFDVRLEDPEERLLPEDALPPAGGEPVRLLWRERPRANVTVRFPDGSFPPLWRVRATPRDWPEEVLETVVGRDRTRLTLPAHRTTITVEVPGHADPAPLVLEPDPDRVHEAEFRIDPTERTGILATWILTRDDLPLDVPIRILAKGPEGEQPVAPNALGGLVLRRLPAGRHEVRVLREGRDDAGSPTLAVDLAAGGRVGRTLRADPVLLVVEDGGEGEGPLRIGDGIAWAAGTRMRSKVDLDEVLEFFADRSIGLEVIRDGELTTFRAPASSLARYRLVEALR